MPPSTTPAKRRTDRVRAVTEAFSVAQRAWLDANPGKVLSIGIATDLMRPGCAAAFPSYFVARTAGRDVLFDAICLACNLDVNELTRAAKGQVVACKRDLLEVCEALTAEEICRRADAFRKKYAGATCTPTALAKHWPEFGANAEARTRGAKRDQYLEPDGWAAAFRRLYKGADQKRVEDSIAAGWAALGPVMRREIIAAMDTPVEAARNTPLSHYTDV